MNLTVHFLDSSFGSMPTDVSGPATLDECGGLHVAGRSIQKADVIGMHEGPCDHRDQRTPAARANFHRKYGHWPEERR